MGKQIENTDKMTIYFSKFIFRLSVFFLYWRASLQLLEGEKEITPYLHVGKGTPSFYSAQLDKGMRIDYIETKIKVSRIMNTSLFIAKSYFEG